MQERREGERAEGEEESFGSNLGEFEGPNTKQRDGGGRAGRCPATELEKTEGRGQFRHGQPEYLPGDRYGNDDQGGRFYDYGGKYIMCAAQTDQERMRTGALEGLLPCRLLWMLFQKECDSGPHDERHQRRDDHCNWRVESESIMERGVHTGKDRAHSTFPCHKTVSAKEPGQARS
eukprot:16442471-Heterocapsa_arctica.AAC.1